MRGAENHWGVQNICADSCGAGAGCGTQHGQAVPGTKVVAGSWAGWVADETAGVNSADNAGVHIIGTAGAQSMGVAMGAVLGNCLGVCAGVRAR